MFVKFLQRVTHKIWARHIIRSASSIVLREAVLKCRRSAASPHTASASSFRFSESIRHIALWFRRNDVTTKLKIVSKTAGFRRDVDEICCLLEFYTASSGNSLPMFRRQNLSVSSSRVNKSNKKTLFFDFFTLKVGTDMLCRNVGKV